MTIKLYNSLTRKKEIFKPIVDGRVKLYSCGPTVYDHVHIGNLRAFVFTDLLQRVLHHIGHYDMTWVMNITDIDDKMIARAQQAYPGFAPAEALAKLSSKFERLFFEDLDAVGVRREAITSTPRATEHIPGMQKLILDLLSQGIAYESEGSIYFSLEQYEKRGHKYGQLVDVHYDGKSRIDDQDQKQGAGDFALWKAAKIDEPSWDFEVNGKNLPGRPGWHIECTVMSQELLGKEFDIHTGGVDLKFPHHENEIAQAGGKLANYWLHNEFLQVESTKMSKSLNNFTTLKDVGDPLVFRLLILSSHYRSQMDYSKTSFDDAVARMQALRELTSRVVNNDTKPSQESLNDWRVKFNQAMSDDLATPQALAVLAEFEKAKAYGEDAEILLREFDAILGLNLFANVTKLRQGAIDMLLTEREAARKSQDWVKSDRLREEILSHGVGLEDTEAGQVIWEVTM